MRKTLPDRRTLLKLLGASGLAALTGLAGFQAGRATSIQEQIPITKGSFASPASYIIFKDGDLIKAKNGKTGQVEFLGTDAAEVMQSAINALPAQGGKIILREGEYVANVSLRSGVELVGCGRAENYIDYPDIPKTGTVINGSVTIEGAGPTTPDRIFGAVLRDLFIKGCLKIKYAVGATVENVFVHANGGTYGVWVDSSYATTFRGVRVAGATYGFYIHNENASDNPSNVWLHNCFPECNEYGIYGDMNKYHTIVFTNGWIEIRKAFYGYALWIADSRIVMGKEDINAIECVVLHATNLRLTGDGYGTAIKIRDWGYAHLATSEIEKFANVFYPVSNVVIHGAGIKISNCGQIFHPDTGSPVRAWLNGRIYGIDNGLGVMPTVWVFNGHTNANILSKNAGTATFSGDGSTTQFAIAHGLVGEPKTVNVTPLSADAAGDFYVTKDSTYIYVNYLSPPPSGTDNVVLSWRAEV